MDWENKTKMVQLGNQRNNSEKEKKEFQKFILDHVDLFDGQAWDMFSNLVDLIVDEMKKDLKFWKEIYFKIKDVDCNDERFGFRSGMRIAMIQTICEDEFFDNIKTNNDWVKSQKDVGLLDDDRKL